VIPGNELSSTPQPAPFTFPFSRDDALTDFEFAGVGIQDPSQGLDVQMWKLRYLEETGEFMLSAPNYPETSQFVRFNVSYVSLSFDSNMNPFISFTEAGVSTFWWFDTVPQAQIFSNNIIPTSSSPYATLDDTRPLQNTARDNLLFYVRGGSLYYRQQRDRYTIERLLATGVVGEVLIAAMQTNLRVGIIVGSF